MTAFRAADGSLHARLERENEDGLRALITMQLRNKQFFEFACSRHANVPWHQEAGILDILSLWAPEGDHQWHAKVTYHFANLPHGANTALVDHDACSNNNA